MLASLTVSAAQNGQSRRRGVEPFGSVFRSVSPALIEWVRLLAAVSRVVAADLYSGIHTTCVSKVAEVPQ
jgi:hypothetical protein